MFVTIVSFIVVFGLMVLFHEMGHFLVAKLNHIKVNEFAIGMGPRIFYKTLGETEYSLRLLPLGGFIKMEGEDEASDSPRSFSNQSPLRRISVVIAGPAMNFLLSILLLALIAFSVGFPTQIIDEVQPGLPAEQSGMVAGDRIVAINGEPIDSWNEVTEVISRSEGELSLVLERDGTSLSLAMMPEIEEGSGRRIIGISPVLEKALWSSVGYGVEQTGFIIGSIFDFLGDLISGAEVEGEIIGPIGIVGIVGEAASTGILSLAFIAAYLSINLGIINLLPFPALDGGRILFLFFEIVRGRPIPPEKEGMAHFIGFALLMALMVFVLYQDIMKLF
ncbi:MAG: RIP metalloprotease RseP [delta proteobacterium ML8_F1]|nr:MAG: RIP metalloprotease RseP [delta proteobacterium ML8_F1]